MRPPPCDARLCSPRPPSASGPWTLTTTCASFRSPSPRQSGEGHATGRVQSSRLREAFSRMHEATPLIQSNLISCQQQRSFPQMENIVEVVSIFLLILPCSYINDIYYSREFLRRKVETKFGNHIYYFLICFTKPLPLQFRKVTSIK